MKNTVIVREIPMFCATCDSKEWEISIGHQSDDRTMLIMKCANENCRDNRRQELNAAKDEIIIGEEFDITGQGYDEEDLEQPTEDTMVN